ncbi:MAG: hypothetical protein VKN13_09005 [Cyanobacteriota bacterium]|nr:hypothetical protein [Cyanobacteriota bacterium]
MPPSLIRPGRLVGLLLIAACPAVAAPAPYAEAVARSRQAAESVLARDGAESCLRGKLTQALLQLSDSCELNRQANPLCGLAHRAAVVTPMDQPFMDATARSLLDLTAGH